MRTYIPALLLICGQTVQAQTQLYPQHFDLSEVTLLDSPFKTAMDLNNELLMQYDVDRLLTPYVRQSGLASTTDTSSAYYQWEANHPSFDNWGNSAFNLDGHVGGHYLTAISLAYASCRDAGMKSQLKTRLDYMVSVMKDCQDRYDSNTEGLYGFIGGQPINNVWTDLHAGNIATYRNYGGWVPLYVQHKILAGLRDAYIYGGNATALEVFRKMADWSVNVIANISDSDLQTILDIEHGGMNEPLIDACLLFGDTKYLTAAKRYSHQTMVSGMQGDENAYSTTFLDYKHANTQVPKYIGFERVYEQDGTSTYGIAARNFWDDVAGHRTVCIGGNSVAEHFLAVANSNAYIDNLDGPESCNTNNMLKLSEMLADRTHDAKYADFYEYALWNHILSTQDPTTGGYVYFTTLRPQGYRIYSQVNQAMWCCVGTGMENHGKYGHFIYTHDGSSTLYVNLFTASTLESDDFAITQQTDYPYSQTSTLTVQKAGAYTIAIRHPWWTTDGYSISVNGTPQAISVSQGTASYVNLSRTWSAGDVITVNLPMELRYTACPNYTDYISFQYGPILLAAQTTASSQSEATATGLSYEALQNEYGGEGRMDHAPGSRASSKNLTSAPLLIGDRDEVLGLISESDAEKLQFTIDTSRPEVASYTWGELTLRPFYEIHHARYMCYWYQQTAENYANSTMAQTEAANEALVSRTLDFVSPGEQQSEAGHDIVRSSDSSTGTYNSESYRDAENGGYVQFTLFNPTGVTENLSVLCRFTTADAGRKGTLYVDETAIASITIPSSYSTAVNGFYNVEFPIPANLAVDGSGNAKEQFIVKFAADQNTLNPGLYGMRLMKDFSLHEYHFVANEWKTGDANRLIQSNITYDEATNSLTVNQTGNNNVCLTLDYEHTVYTIAQEEKYLIVRGSALSLEDGASYLWWLNGSNHGTQVKPTVTRSIRVDGRIQQVIAWDMTKTGIAENVVGERPDVTVGQTIFGLTSSSSFGQSVIYDISFAESLETYIKRVQDETDAVVDIRKDKRSNATVFNVQGQPMKGSLDAQPQGIYLVDGKKVMVGEKPY